MTPGEYIRVVRDNKTFTTMKLEMWDTAGCERVFSTFTKLLANIFYVKMLKYYFSAVTFEMSTLF